MPQQLDLDLETPLDPKEERRRLETEYKEIVKKDPLGRAFSLERLKKGIADPKGELDRLRVEDTISDRIERENMYRK